MPGPPNGTAGRPALGSSHGAWGWQRRGWQRRGWQRRRSPLEELALPCPPCPRPAPAAAPRTPRHPCTHPALCCHAGRTQPPYCRPSAPWRLAAMWCDSRRCRTCEPCRQPPSSCRQPPAGAPPTAEQLPWACGRTPSAGCLTHRCLSCRPRRQWGGATRRATKCGCSPGDQRSRRPPPRVMPGLAPPAPPPTWPKTLLQGPAPAGGGLLD